MSEPKAESEIPQDIGRNEPCPCGSGRKYKKCCQKAHRLQQESQKKNNQPHLLVTAETIPWKVYRVLSQIHENNALGLFHDLCHDAGPFRERFADKPDLITAVDNGEEILAAGPDFEMIHFRLDPPDTYLLLREDDPKKAFVNFQIITLRLNQLGADGVPREVEHQGYRVWDYRNERIHREEIDGVPPLERFDIQWRPAAG